MNILIVEDEDALRLPVLKMLRDTGFYVIEANNGTLALEVLRSEETVDLLLLDISLPGASSREVFAEAGRLIPRIPVIVTTAFSKREAGAILAADIDHFIQKPYHFQALLDAIWKVAR